MTPGVQEEGINGSHQSKSWLKQMDAMALPASGWMDEAISPYVWWKQQEVSRTTLGLRINMARPKKFNWKD